MFICDFLKQEVKFLHGDTTLSIIGDFPLLYQKIQINYHKKINFFVGIYGMIDNLNAPIEILLLEKNKIIQVSVSLWSNLGIKKILSYLFAFDVDMYSKIYSEELSCAIYMNSQQFSTQQNIDYIYSEEELLKYGINYRTSFDEYSSLYTTISNFSFEWGKYNRNQYIDTDAMGIDSDRELSIAKSLSEAIERASGANTTNLISVNASDLSAGNLRILDSFGVAGSKPLVGAFLQSLVGTENLFLSENLLCYPVSTQYKYETNSSGMATHHSLEAAIYSALMELIERDSFLYTWLLKSKFVYRISHDTLNSSILKTIQNSKYSIEFYLLDCYVPVYTVMCIVQKDGKNMISLGTDLNLNVALEKSFQESRNSIDFFDLDLNDLNRRGSSSVMEHIFYYLDPNNANKLLRIKKTQIYDKNKDSREYLKTYQDIINRFRDKNIDLGYFEYENLINLAFQRRTVRVFSSALLPIYFGNVIPSNILNHPRLIGGDINYDLHPLG